MKTDQAFDYRQWLHSKLESAGRRKSRRRKAVSNEFSPIAAEVQQLESRALLSMTYHGGVLLSSVELQPVYLGSDWQTTPNLQTQIGQLNQFSSTIVQSTYMDMLSNAGYNVGRGSATAGAVGNIGLTKGINSPVTDAQIQADLQSMINSGQVQAPDANRLYMVFVEPGVVISMGGVSSATAFLGYHGAFGGHTSGGQAIDIHYGVISYPGSPNFSSGSQGFSSDIDDLTAVSSHELAEACTDANVNFRAGGWYDNSTGYEVADPAEGHLATVGGYVVQDVVNQSLQIIAPSVSSPTPPPSPPPSPPPAANVGTPTLSANALSPTAAQLSWTAVSGSPQGYRVYDIIGSQTTLVATVGGSTTSYQVTGLPSASRVSFKVEAYNSRSIADSQVVGVTLPTPPVGTPVLSTQALSPTSARLSWSGVSGTPVGYRVYEIVGSQSVLLTTVAGSTTSCQVNGLPAGTRVSFKVEAYNSSSIADSSVASLTLPTPPVSMPSLSAQAQSPTSALLSWTAASGGPLGYRVYEIIGSQTTLVATVGGSTTSCQLNSLPAGSRVSFKVEAYNSVSIADSQIVSVSLPAPPVTIPALQVQALSPTSAQLTWNAVSGIPVGYRVYEIIGSQTVLLATVNASTTSYQVNSLTAGSRVSFKVEAYNSASIADSQVVALTMPLPPPTPPQVTASNVTHTSALLSWNSILGAQGYRIYIMIGNQQTLLGTVSSNTTSAQINSLTANGTFKFMVVAFSGNTVANSAWITVTTPR